MRRQHAWCRTSPCTGIPSLYNCTYCAGSAARNDKPNRVKTPAVVYMLWISTIRPSGNARAFFPGIDMRSSWRST
jgi:hypothetical protein